MFHAPSQDSKLKTRNLILAASSQSNVFNVLKFGSPPWIRTLHVVFAACNTANLAYLLTQLDGFQQVDVVENILQSLRGILRRQRWSREGCCPEGCCPEEAASGLREVCPLATGAINQESAIRKKISAGSGNLARLPVITETDLSFHKHSPTRDSGSTIAFRQAPPTVAGRLM